MKKLAALIFTTLIVLTSLSAKENLFSVSAGLTSGVPIYGTNSVASTGSEIEKGIGTQFDPRFAKIMLKLIDEDPDYTMHETD